MKKRGTGLISRTAFWFYWQIYVDICGNVTNVAMKIFPVCRSFNKNDLKTIKIVDIIKIQDKIMFLRRYKEVQYERI